MSTLTATTHRGLHREGLQERSEAHLVPGLRRLRRRAGHLPRAGQHRPAAARDRVHLRHRLLEPHSRLHDGVRLQHRARARAARSRRASSWRTPTCWCSCAGGDGDGFSIGGGHVAHAIRRNIDITYIVMDNQIYGLTKGQLSPTSRRGLATASSAHGSMESPVNPLLYVLGYGARVRGAGHAGRHERPRDRSSRKASATRVSPSSTCSRRASPTAWKTRC